MSQHRNSRSRARRRTLQALYQWQVGNDESAEILRQFLESKRGRAESEYFTTLFRGVTGMRGELDALADAYLDRPLAQLDPIERAVLWISLFEFRDCLEVPYRAVINEAIELAREFGGADGHKYVNAVLDRAAVTMRPHER